MLTPNQLKYCDEYCRKSGDTPEEFAQIPPDHNVYEWGDGAFLDYFLFDRSKYDYFGNFKNEMCFYIYCFFSKHNTVEKFKQVYKVAKYQNCDTITFVTSRDRDAFARSIHRIGKKFPMIKPIETTFEMKIGEENEE